MDRLTRTLSRSPFQQIRVSFLLECMNQPSALPFKRLAQFCGLISAFGLSLSSMTISLGDAIDPAKYDHPVRVACLGDSITKGEGTSDPATLGYPAQLQQMLGDKWEVKNFGVGGRTLLRKQDPYNYNPAKRFLPDVIIIMLGTNDSRQATWDKHGDDFVGDYKAMIDSLKALSSSPKIFICAPTPMFPGNYGLSDELLTSKVIPLVTQVATKENVPLIDLHTAMIDHKDEFPDHVHPNVDGAKHIAEVVDTALTASSSTTQPPTQPPTQASTQAMTQPK